MPTTEPTSLPTETQTRTLSGRWVVVGVISFGLLLTGLLRVYWHQHIEPFMPLQMAIADEFPNSSPRVEGGQRRIHRKTPRVLRITMRSDFDPTAETDEANDAVDSVFKRVVGIAANHIDLALYEQVDLHLYFPSPEDALRQKSVSKPVGSIDLQ